MLDYRMNLQAAIDAPRWKLEGGMTVDLEASAAPELRAGLMALGHNIESRVDSYMDFGAGQCAFRVAGGYVGGSDSRRDGQCAGF
jgi:gamma-glutamyltranspeptidase/glutathione hydrolase